MLRFFVCTAGIVEAHIHGLAVRYPWEVSQTKHRDLGWAQLIHLTSWCIIIFWLPILAISLAHFSYLWTLMQVVIQAQSGSANVDAVIQSRYFGSIFLIKQCLVLCRHLILGNILRNISVYGFNLALAAAGRWILCISDRWIIWTAASVIEGLLWRPTLILNSLQVIDPWALGILMKFHLCIRGSIYRANVGHISRGWVAWIQRSRLVDVLHLLLGH